MEIAIVIAVVLLSIQIEYDTKPFYTGAIYRFVELLLGR